MFVRLAGCDLRCWWCDTPYALKKNQGKQMPLEEIIAEVKKYNAEAAVVTGGEPLIQPETPNLLHQLQREGKFVTLETNATQYRPIECNLVSISPKLASSVSARPEHSKHIAGHERAWLNIEAIQSFIDNHDVQLKFVVEDKEDVTEVEEILGKLKRVNRHEIMLMAQARTKQEYRRRAPQVAQWCIEKGFRLSPRLQVEMWGRRRGR